MNFSSYTWTWFLIVLVSCRQPEVHQAPQKIIDSVKVKAKSGQMLKKYIVFFGNSITAGLGLDPSESFPAQIQSRLDSLHLPYQVVNAGVSGETSADGVSRIDWILQQPVFIFVLELGGNDGLRGIAPEENMSVSRCSKRQTPDPAYTKTRLRLWLPFLSTGRKHSLIASALGFDILLQRLPVTRPTRRLPSRERLPR